AKFRPGDCSHRAPRNHGSFACRRAQSFSEGFGRSASRFAAQKKLKPMSFPLPDSEFRTDEPAPQSPWRIVDLIVFAVFFLLTVLLLPITVLRVWHIFSPELRVADLIAV